MGQLEHTNPKEAKFEIMVSAIEKGLQYADKSHRPGQMLRDTASTLVDAVQWAV